MTPQYALPTDISRPHCHKCSRPCRAHTARPHVDDRVGVNLVEECKGRTAAGCTLGRVGVGDTVERAWPAAVGPTGEEAAEVDEESARWGGDTLPGPAAR